MLYLLDANVLIRASKDYYPLDRVPEFWEWVLHVGKADQLKIPLEIYEEITAGNDPLSEWMKSDEANEALSLDEEADPNLVSKVTNEGYAPDLTDIEIVEVGRDPFLISYGLVVLGGRSIVTTEVSKPGAKRANRKVPDVCKQFDVPCCDTFQMINSLNFSTKWKTPT